MKRYAFLLLLLPFFLAPHKAAAQTSQEKCQQGACYGFGAPSGACVGAFIYTDISVTPMQAYSCKANVWGWQGGGSTGGTLPSGAIADYRFTEGTGATVTDFSGNGNNGTFAATAPTWGSPGLVFTGQAGVQLPAALNISKTIIVAVYINPLTGTYPIAQSRYSLLLSSSLGNGYNLTYSNTSVFSYRYSLTNFASGNTSTATDVPMSGFHVFASVLGTGSGNVDHLYMDGVELPYAGSQGASGTAQASGNFFLGSANTGVWTTGGLEGTYYRAVFFSGQLTAAQVQTVSTQIASSESSLGVPVKPLVKPQSVQSLHCIGDSITFGSFVTTPFCSSLTLTNQPAYTVKNWGLPTFPLLSFPGSEPNRVTPQCKTASGASIATVLAGTNDWATYPGTTLTTLMANLAAEIEVLKSAGCKVFVGTMLSRQGNDANSVLLDTDKDIYDAAILAQARELGADGVVDYAANPLLGADNAWSNATYFRSADGTHPTQVGANLMAVALSNTLNYYTGYTISNPHIVTANTYALLSSDGAVTAAPTGTAAYTMPDCTGPSGVFYTISNPQSAFAVTITGGASQPINGLSSAITIAANSTVTLRDVPNAKSVSGCHWAM